jgi:hypothetical protein
MAARGTAGRAIAVEVDTHGDAASTAVTPPAAERSRPGEIALRWAPLLVALPGLAAAASVLAQGWIPTTDQAVEVLRVADVGTGHTPLTGPWSRFGWDHPGPLLFWMSAPGYRAFGPTGVAATVALVHAASAAGAVVAARRIGGAVLAALVAAGVGVISLVMGDWLVNPWNPYVGTLALLAGFLCAWGASRGDGRMLAGAVVAGSWAVQAHLGYAAVVAAAALWCMAAYLIRRRGGVRLGGRQVAAAVAIGVLCWSGPLWDEVSSPPGNLRDLASYARQQPEQRIAGGDVLDEWGHLFGVPAAWMGADARYGGTGGDASEPQPALRALAVVAAAVLAGAWSWRRGRREPAWFVAYVVALVVASAAAVARTPAPFASYLAMWSWAVAALVWVAAGWAGASALRSDRGRRVVTGAAAALALGTTALATVVAATADGPAAAEGRVVEALSVQARDELGRGGVYRLVAADRGYGVVAVGLMADLRRRGYDVRMTQSMTALEERERIEDDAPVAALTVLTVTGTVPSVPAEGARLIASRDTLSGADRAELDLRARAVRAATGMACLDELDLRSGDAVADAAAAGADRDDAARVAQLQRAGARTEVWLAPPGPLDRPLDQAALAAACGAA